MVIHPKLLHYYSIQDISQPLIWQDLEVVSSVPILVSHLINMGGIGVNP
jgi:hypothetical protein